MSASAALLPATTIHPRTRCWPWLLPTVALALWPVWCHMAATWTRGAELESLGVLLLATVLALKPALDARGEPRLAALVPAALLLLLYALLYPRLPALGRCYLGMAAWGCLLTSLPGVGWRHRSALPILCLLGVPAADTLQFVLGPPLRAGSALAAAALLSLAGWPARAEGPSLWIGERLVSVDAPCSGVNGLWSAVTVAALLATAWGVRPLRTAALGALAVLLALPMNGWRAATLVYLPGLKLGSAEELTHTALGAVVFCCWLLLLAAAAWRWRLRSPEVPRMGVDVASRGSLILLAAAARAAVAPLAAAPTRAAAPTLRFPGWPATWGGSALQRLPLTPADQRWAALSPGPLARFRLENGDELLLRWVERPGRAVHPPEDCYRGTGFSVRDLAPVIAPAGKPESRGVQWRRFLAQRGTERYLVRGVILSTRGPSYPDPAWWWWSVAGPGASDRGPWWVMTVSRRLPPEEGS